MSRTSVRNVQNTAPDTGGGGGDVDGKDINPHSVLISGDNDANSLTIQNSTGNTIFNVSTVSGNTTINGDLTVNGTATFIETKNLDVTNSMISLNNGAPTGSNVRDIGFYGLYIPAATPLYTGFIKQASTGIYKLFDANPTVPNLTVSNIDSYLGDLSVKTMYISSILDIANGLTTIVRSAIANGNLAVTNSGTGSITFTTDGSQKLSINAANITSLTSFVLPNSGNATATMLNFGTAGTGIYGTSTSVVFSVANVDILSVLGTGVQSTQPFLGPNGAAATPSFGFASDPSTGFYRSAASTIMFTCGNANKLSISSSIVSNLIPVALPLGTVGAPTLTNNSDTTTGIYFPSSTQIAMSVAGVNRLNVAAALSTFTTAIALPVGTATTPQIYFSDSQTGIYADSTDNIRFTVSGALKFSVLSASILSAVQIVSIAGSAAATGINFGTAGTGLYGTASAVSISAGGINVATFNSSGVNGTVFNGAGTGLTGTAASLTAGTCTTIPNLTGMVTSVGNATTVVTNANLTGEATSVGNAVTLDNASVISKVLTGFVANAGVVSSADSILSAFNKVVGNINAIPTGSVSSVSVVTANGFAGSVADPGTTPAITISTTITGILKGNGTAISAATAGTDYSAGTSALATGILKSTTATGTLSIAVAGDFPILNQDTTGTAAKSDTQLITNSSANSNFNVAFYSAGSGYGAAFVNAATLNFNPSQGRFTAPIIEAYDGSVSAPAHTFANSANTGVYYESPGRYNYTVAGTKFATMNDSGRFRFYPDSTKIEQQVLEPYIAAGAEVGYASSISADGNTLVLGAPGSGTNGNAAVYTRSNGVWTLQQSLVSLATTLNTTTPSEFGYSSVLSADGNTCAIGAYGELTNTGAVYVFSRTGGSWSYFAKISLSNNTGNTLTLTGNDTTTNSGLGGDCFLSANGTTLAIGAPLHNSNSGAVWICARNGNTCTQQTVIKSTAGGVVLTGLGSGGSNFGHSTQISSDGNELVVGAPSDTSTGGAGTPDTGAAFVFTRATGGDTWSQQAMFRTTTAATKVVLITGSVGAARLGEDVSISSNGNTILIGGSADNGSIGAVWVFNRATDGITWTQNSAKYVPTGLVGAAEFGFWTTITGDANDFAAGAPGDNTDEGGFVCYDRNIDTNLWIQQSAIIKGSFAPGTSRLGSTITSAENFSCLVVGAPTFAGTQGAAGVFIAQTASIITPGGIFSGNFGSARQPTYNCDAGKRTSGLYFPDANSCALSADGMAIAKFTSSTSNSGQIQMYSRGNASNPSYSFMEETNTGMFLEGIAYTGRIGFSTLGSKFCIMNDSGRMRFYNNNVKQQQTNPPIIPTTAASSACGSAVAISADGNTAIIGCPTATGGGNAFIYVRADTIWSEQANLRTLAGAAIVSTVAEFGYSANISSDGDTAVVGSPGEIGGATGLGAVYIYLRTGTSWAFQAKLGLATVPSCTITLTLNTGNSRLGSDVFLSANGNTLAIGAPSDATNRGAVWICVRNVATWSQQIALGSVTAAGRYGYTGFSTGITVTQFGYSIQLSASGNTLVVGGPRDGSNGTTGGTLDTGAVWVFQRATGATTWTQQVLFRLATAAANVVLYTGNNGTAIRFGEDVTISGDGTFVGIGATFDNSNQGKMWIYQNTTGSTWVQQTTLVPTGLSATAQFGYWASMTGDANDLMVGAPQNTVTAVAVGALVSYERNPATGAWTQSEAPNVPAGNTGACTMGYSVSSSENAGAVIAGAPGNNSGVGGAFVWIEQTASLVTPKGVYSGTLGSMKQPTFNSNTGGRSSGLYFPDLNSCALSADGSGVVRFLSNQNANSAQLLAYNRGTVALPTYSWNEDPSTGIYSSAASAITFATAGVARLTLSTSATFTVAVTTNGNINGAAITASGTMSATTVTASTAGSGVFILSGNSSAGTGYGTAIQNTGSMFASANELMRFGNTMISSVTPVIGAQLVRIAPSTTANFRIADSVAMSGDGSFIFAGAPGTGSTVTAFYIYQIVKTGSVVALSQTITAQPTGATGTAGAIRLGQAICCSDDANHVFLTSSGDSTNVGAMWYYTRTVVGVTCTWAQSGTKIVPSDFASTATPRIGSSIACDSNATYIALAGCPLTAINPVVWFYKRVDTTVSQLATGFTLTGLAAAAGTFVSTSMSADGNYAAFGVPTDNTNQGAVYIFARTANTDTWAQTQIIRATTAGAGILLYTGANPTANSFGRGVALSGDGSRLVVGAPNETNTAATAGATWVFNRAGSTWTQLIRLVYSTTAATLAGTSVSIARNGWFGYAGAPGNATNVGAVFMFSIAPFSNAINTYVARAALSPSGNGATPNYGSCIAMSSDGGNAIVGGPNETNTGAQAGCIYIIGGSGGKIQSTEQHSSLYTGIPASVNYGIAFDGNSSGLYWKYNSTAFTYRPAISHRGFEVVNFSSANTVTNPLLSFNNDLSGVYMPTTTTLAFNLASSERLRLTDADGLTNSRIITQVSRVPDSGTASATNASVRATFSILSGQFNEVSWSPGLATTGFTQTPSGAVSTAVSTIPYVFNGTPATGQTLIFTTPSLAIGVYRISYNTLYTADSAIVVLRFQQSGGADVDIRTYDAYSATSAVVSYVSYMTITTAGVAAVKWFTNSQNGSSSGFLMNVSSLRLELLQ